MSGYSHLLARANSFAPFSSLLDLWESPDGFGVTTSSNLQKALCLVADEKAIPDDLWADPWVANAFKGVRPAPKYYQEILILSGTRTGKSLWSACRAVWAAQTCNMSRIRKGEIPRVSVVSLRLDNAQVIHNHLVGTILQSRKLKSLLLEQPTADTVLIRHPSGNPVEIKVVAGGRAGGSLVSRWSAGVIFDEAPRMQGQEDGVVNLDDMRDAIGSRMLERAPILYVGSPWAPQGTVYNMMQEHHGKADAPILCVRAPAYAMNPVYWTETQCELLRRQNPDAYRTDVEAEFADPESSLFPSTLVEQHTREGPLLLSYDERLVYTAAMDPGTKGNSWTFALAAIENSRYRIAYNKQWTGSRANPLRPHEVLEEISRICKAYKVYTVYSDQWADDVLKDLALRYGIGIASIAFNAMNKVQMFESMRTRLETGGLELPPDPQVKADLIAVKKRITNGGTNVVIVLPNTTDGRHCDYGPCLALLAGRYLDDSVNIPVETVSEEEQMLLFDEKPDPEWWETGDEQDEGDSIQW